MTWTRRGDMKCSESVIGLLIAVLLTTLSSSVHPMRFSISIGAALNKLQRYDMREDVQSSSDAQSSAPFNVGIGNRAMASTAQHKCKNCGGTFTARTADRARG